LDEQHKQQTKKLSAEIESLGK
jgi:phage shock protein A